MSFAKLGVRIVIAFLIVAVALSWHMTPISSYAEGPSRLKVVWLSVDSANYYRLYNFTAAGELPAFKKIFEGGAHGPMVVVYPSATAVNHASLSSGAPPGATGIVANSIVLPGSRVTSTVSGFSGRYMAAEPLWVTAERNGLKTIVISFPQSTPPAWSVDPEKTVLFNIYDAFVSPISFSTLYTNNRNIPRATYIDVREASEWKGVEAFKDKYKIITIYKAWESSFSIGDSQWYVYLADTSGYGKPDLLAIVPETKDLSKTLEVLREGAWSKPLNTTITFRGQIYVVAPMFKLVKLDPDDLRLYRGIMRPLNTPWFNNEKLAREVWNNVIVRVGTFTDGDWFALVNEWIDVKTYMETVAFTNKFFMEFTSYVMKKADWDLIMTYTPIIDNVYHQFLGMLYKEMPYYSPDKEEYYRNLILEAYKLIDEFVASILANIDVKNTVLIVTSDHGQCPVKYIVNVNAILHNAGLLSVRGGSVALNETKAWYSGHGHIFVNIEGRDQGIVKAGDYRSVVKAVIEALQSVRDPDTGEPVFDLILDRSQAHMLGLWGDRVGDVVFSTKCGYTAAGGVPTIREGRAVVFTPADPLKTVVGDHGTILPWYKDLHATFIAYGGNVKAGYIGLTSALNVAPTVSQILNIEKPRDAVAPPLPITEPAPATVTTSVTVTMPVTVPKTITETKTATAIQTVTDTRYVTQYTTLTKTEEKPVTRTATSYETVTQVQHRTVTETETLLTTEPTTLIAVGLIGVIIGIILYYAGGYFLYRRGGG